MKNKAKKVFIAYFSGTGNTDHAINEVQKKLEKNNFKIVKYRIKKDFFYPDDSFDFLIFAFPILGMSAPLIVKKYIKKLPKFNNDKKLKASILEINGALIHNNKIINGWGGQAVSEIQKLLKKKKIEVFLTYKISFPENWTQVSNPPSLENSKKIYKIGDKNIIDYSNKFIKNKNFFINYTAFDKAWSKIVSKLFLWIGRRFMGKIYVACKNCTSCKICIKACPSGTIFMFNNKPAWKSNCLGCNRCINICPEKAIQVSVLKIVLHFLMNVILSIAVIFLIFFYMPSVFIGINFLLLISIQISTLFGLSVFLIWLEFVIIDYLLLLIQQVPFINYFFELNFTGGFRRYIFPGFKPLKK